MADTERRTEINRLQHNITRLADQGGNIKKPGEPVEIIELLKQGQEHAAIVREIGEKAAGDLIESPGAIRSLGKGLFGSSLRPDGQDWTLDDIDSLWDRSLDIQEKKIRKRLTEEVLHGLDQMDGHFHNPEDPERTETDDIAKFTVTVLDRVLSSNDHIGDDYPFSFTATHEEALLLEGVRFTLLRPTYSLVEIADRGFYLNDKLQAEEEEKIRAKVKNPRNMDEYNKIQKEQAMDNPKSYTDKDWKVVLDVIKRDFLNHLKRRSMNSAQDKAITAKEAPNIVHEGKPFFSQEVLEALNLSAQQALELAAEIAKLSTFNQVLPFIRERFGENATYGTLLQKIDPVKNPKKDKN